MPTASSTCRPGHVTASAWVTTPARDRFLLVHHRKLDRWLQPGGHVDGQADIRCRGLGSGRPGLPGQRATRDETAATSTPLDLDVHVIPARYDAAGLRDRRRPRAPRRARAGDRRGRPHAPGQR